MPSIRKYARISLSNRQKLISLIYQERLSIYQAAKRLSINKSTAKLIVKKFRETGTFTKRNDERIEKSSTKKQSEYEVPENPGPLQKNREEQKFDQIDIKIPQPIVRETVSAENYAEQSSMMESWLFCQMFYPMFVLVWAE